MARVKFEFWDNGDYLQEAEAEHTDPHEAFERAVRMARAALPPKPKLEPGSYSMVVNNVRLDPATKEIFMGASVPPNNFTVRIAGSRTAEKGQCQERCPQSQPGHSPHRCGRILNHDGQHLGDDGCAWLEDPERCPEELAFSQCAKPKGHAGQHVDNNRCSHCCPENHGTPAQCTLRRDHTGSHRSRIADGNCYWGDPPPVEEADCA